MPWSGMAHVAGAVERVVRPVVLSPDQQAEAVDNVLAVRQLGMQLLELFEHSDAKTAADAERGAEAMVAALNRVLELLDAPPELYAEPPR